jgi:hypothetical protein
MALSRRKEIIELVVTELQKIDGGVSTFDAAYTYNLDIASNAFRKLKFLDEINDFPSICVNAGNESRIYHSSGLTEGHLNITARAYVRAEDSTSEAENLADDIEHVIYHLGDRSSIGIEDVTIISMSTDEGLVAPFGILEIDILAKYQLNI